MKTILIFLTIVTVVVLAYLVLNKSKGLYTTKEDCERKTGKQCNLFKGLCQVGMAQNQKEALENEKFMKDCSKKIGTWQPV